MTKTPFLGCYIIKTVIANSLKFHAVIVFSTDIQYILPNHL